ncbi:unnamed protein product, partial [Prorocentrum cordatum]
RASHAELARRGARAGELGWPALPAPVLTSPGAGAAAQASACERLEQLEGELAGSLEKQRAQGQRLEGELAALSERHRAQEERLEHALEASSERHRLQEEAALQQERLERELAAVPERHRAQEERLERALAAASDRQRAQEERLERALAASSERHRLQRGGRAATRWRGARCGGEGRRAGDGGQDAGAPPAPRGGAGAVPGAPAGRAAGGRRARESDEQQPLPADLRARVERLERASASPSSLERLPAGAEASSPRPLALGRVERMERELAALARELAALAQRAPWRNGTAPDDSPAIASASEQRLADRLERELASAAERARASEEAEVRSLAGRVAGMAESVVRQGRNQRGWPVHMARPAARARLPGSAPQGGRSGSSERWRSTVARAQAGANLDLSSIERAQQRELCFRKCKAAKGMAFRTRALVAETLLQMAQATAGSDHQAARDRCAKAAAASRKRHDRRHELLEKVQQTCRRSLGAGHSVERGRSPSPCSLHSEPLLRGDTSSDESAIREAGALVGASNVGLMWNFGRAAPQSDSDSDGSSYFPRYQGGRGAAAARGGGGPTSVDALLRTLKAEPADDVERAAKFGLYEAYFAEVETIRGILVKFHVESRPLLDQQVAAWMDHQMQDIDSRRNMGVYEGHEWLVYHMMQQAHVNNCRMASKLDLWEEKIISLCAGDQPPCPICLQGYTDDRPPQTLGCCHQSCRQCWSSWAPWAALQRWRRSRRSRPRSGGGLHRLPSSASTRSRPHQRATLRWRDERHHHRELSRS